MDLTSGTVHGEYAEVYCNYTETDIVDGEVIFEFSGECCFLLQKIGANWKLYNSYL